MKQLRTSLFAAMTLALAISSSFAAEDDTTVLGGRDSLLRHLGRGKEWRLLRLETAMGARVSLGHERTCKP